jgi:uncharacterized protein YkwD
MICALGAAGCGGPMNTPTDGGSTADVPPSGNPLEDEMLRLVNEARARGAVCGSMRFGPAGPLVTNAELAGAARAHSQDMATRGFFAHNTPEGTTPQQRIMSAGYTGQFPIGENIAAGNATAEETMTQWMGSPGHCSNIMNPAYRQLGVGYYAAPSTRFRHFWTQNFGGAPR